MGPQLTENTYPEDFACTRFGTTDDGSGSVYIYRPLGGPTEFPRGPSRQPGIRVQPMLLSGCVVDIYVEVHRLKYM
jgi:hypothetical protein